MALSYSLRLVCLILCSLGLLQVATELLLWTLAPLLQRLLPGLPARRQELALYAVQILPTAMALLIVTAGLVPDYIRHETNLASERVGWFCLALSTSISVWIGFTFFRGLRVLLETARFTRACRRRGEGLAVTHGGTPVLTFRERPRRLALIGLLRPFILISASLVEQGGLEPMALEIVLDHERAHAVQRDNWKLLSLTLLPRLNLSLRDGRTWTQHWRNALECAADDDAVRGDSTRALLLAETLIAFSRHASADLDDLSALPQAISTALVCGETDLVTRVDRLIQLDASEEAQHHGKGLVLLCSTLLGGAAVLALLLPVLGDLPEHILHLG